MKHRPGAFEWVGVMGALVWVVLYFAPWYDLGESPLGPATGADAGGTRWILWLLALAALVLVLARWFFDEPPSLLSDMRTVGILGIILVGGTLAAAFVWELSVDAPATLLISPAWGLWACLAAAVAVAVGGWGAWMQESRTTSSTEDGEFTSRPDAEWTFKPPERQGDNP